MIDYLKALGAIILAALAFFFGKILSDNKANKEKLKIKQDEEKSNKELQARIIKRDNVSINSKREWLRSRAETDK